MISWFKSKYTKHPEKIQVPKLRFWGEQDGVPERELKDRLIEFFQCDQTILRAYLARVAYSDRSPLVIALCLRSEFGPDRGVVEKIGKIFASMFGSHEHLDIIFLDGQQESELAKVCSPFFDDPTRDT
jgi:hypothetical protein